MRLAAIAVAMLFAMICVAGCSAPRSARCKEICEKEADCAEQHQVEGVKFDKGECIASCTALERDEEGEELVAEHARCLAEAGDSCAEVYACK